MNLDAGAVELPLDCGTSGSGQRLLEALSGLGQHRQYRSQDGQSKTRQPSSALRNGRFGHGTEIAGQHRRSSNIRGGNAGGPGDCLDHHAFEGSLPELAEQKPGEELAFVFGGTPEQPVQLPASDCL
jgi:hypothetical protein